uniref:Uncharacterized protein n=1 Tax=Meloidogyne enterolobii TaxID=390850 RepID=A0A6V7Y0C6_MELEN|nr:unnamed protein product [Meloidogyne enterolobii]
MEQMVSGGSRMCSTIWSVLHGHWSRWMVVVVGVMLLLRASASGWLVLFFN